MNRAKRIAGWWLAAALLAPGAANAMLLGRLPATPGGTDYQAYYDTVLDITWLANANLAATDTFGVSGINSDGTMTWDKANTWIAAMDAFNSGAGYLGYSDWRLPTLSPINGSSFQDAFSNNASTDLGYASSAAWVNGSNTPVSEMGYMYYVNLGNLGYCTPDNSDPSACVAQPGNGLLNTGPLSNLQGNFPYWSGLEYAPAPADAWYFDFGKGYQYETDKRFSNYAWAVLSGDVVAASVPESGTLVLMGTALGGLFGFARRQRRRH